MVANKLNDCSKKATLLLNVSGEYSGDFDTAGSALMPEFRCFTSFAYSSFMPSPNQKRKGAL